MKMVRPGQIIRHYIMIYQNEVILRNFFKTTRLDYFMFTLLNNSENIKMFWVIFLNINIISIGAIEKFLKSCSWCLPSLPLTKRQPNQHINFSYLLLPKHSTSGPSDSHMEFAEMEKSKKISTIVRSRVTAK